MPAGPFKAAFRSFQRRATVCQLYTSPKSGDKINSSTPFTFSWDPSCFSPAPQYVNILLTSSLGQVFQWEQVDAFPGSFDAELDASWWGSTPSIKLQVGIAAIDTPLFLNPFSAGPVFTAVNSDPSASSISASIPSPAVSILGSGSSSGSPTRSSTQTPTPTVFGGSVNVAHLRSQGGLTGGRLAVAVLLPILVAFAAIAGYVFYARKREAFRRAAWVETIDKRMSRISGDWQSMSAVGGVRPSMQSNRARTPVASAHSKSMSMLGGVRPSTSTEANRTTSIYNTHATVPFAAEDLSQLGPRARALSEAAAAGRPISTAISANSDVPVPAMPLGRSRSKSTTADARPVFARAPPSHVRTVSTSSNNPYANAMAQRDSQVISMDGSAVAFPSSSNTPPVPRNRLDSNGRSVDATNRARVNSRVSFAEVSRDRRRNPDAEKQGLRASARNHSTGDEFGIDFGDAYPALALMRVKSGEGLEGVTFPSGGSPLTPTREFLPPSKKNEYFDGMPSSGLGGRTPDEMLKAYASAMGSEKEGAQEPSSSSGVVASLKKFTGLWRK